MCGICGFYSLENRDVKENLKILNSMTETLYHRGPDAIGSYKKENIFLGHTRLSIIDLDNRSNQPFISQDASKILVYNGEIYNFKKIRAILLSNGLKFNTSGDTEVLLKSYEFWGEEMLNYIDGMFAFAIIDFNKNIIFSARDHFGQKPFFYTLQSGSFIFSSELSSLIKHPLVKREIQIENIINYLHHDSFVGEQTPIKNVYKLQPSEYLIFNFKTNNLIKKKYWQIKYGKKKIDQSFSKEFFKLFSNSVDQHFTSDVPIALYLSGGLDSTSIATVAKKNLGFNEFKSFNLKFNDTSFDEDNLAYKVAKELDIELETFELSKKKVNLKVLDLVNKLDEPISDPGYLAVGLISEFIKKKDYKVVMSGDGGDELFGGYEPFLKYNYFNYIKKNKPILFFLRMINSLNFRESFEYMGLSYKFRVFMKGFESNDKFYNSRWLASFLPSEIKDLLNYSEVKSKYENHDIYFFIKELTSNFETDLEKLFIQYQRHYLPNLICSHTDKANMKNSIEARSPFLNKDLFEYVNNFDRHELTTKFKSKKILREFLKKNKMSFIADAKKKGFTIPLASWINDILINDIKDLFSDDFKNSFKFINYDYFEKLIEEHINKKKNNYKKIWSLFVLLRWLKNNRISC